MKLQEKLEARLNSSKFRLLNQNMSRPTLKLTKTDITHYHTGYSQQVNRWPINPLDIIIKELMLCTDRKIADMGCGQAKISQVIKNNEVHSFDKYPVSKQVRKADIISIPIEDSFFDIAVCCLSFMKNEISSYVKECNRILNVGGILYIAELISRIEDINAYKKGIQNMGFKCISLKKKNNFFIVGKFEKLEDCTDNNVKILLKGYKYKKR